MVPSSSLPPGDHRTPTQEDIEMNKRLQQYFEFAANVWLEFAPGDLRRSFRADFPFPRYHFRILFGGELPD